MKVAENAVEDALRLTLWTFDVPFYRSPLLRFGSGVRQLFWDFYDLNLVLMWNKTSYNKSTECVESEQMPEK